MKGGKRTRRRAVWWASLLGVLTVGGAIGASVLVTATDDPLALTGVVVDPRGRPIAGAQVTRPDGSRTVTDGEGRFAGGTESGWVTARAHGWLARTRAGAPGDRVVIRLGRRTKDSVTFAFGGDVMFGRRFYDPHDDGSGNGLLTPRSGAAQHERLLAGVVPLFASADLAVVNLETPLIE